jgi:hypothetical protein
MRWICAGASVGKTRSGRETAAARGVTVRSRASIEILLRSVDDSATEFDDVITLEIRFGSISVPVLLAVAERMLDAHALGG